MHSRQNFAATAEYFERRASRCALASQRRKFSNIAAEYRARAVEAGHRADGIVAVRGAPNDGAGHRDARYKEIPYRRQRLIELFKSYEQAPASGKTPRA